MDTTQLSQMVTWLDEEHRKDRDEITKLQQQIEAQSTLIQEQARRIQDLEGRLASTQAQLTRFEQLEQSIEQLKSEVTLMIQHLEEGMLRSEREMERSRLSDREATTRTIAEIRKEISRIGRIEEELDVRKTEDQRLGELMMELRHQITALSKDLDERTRNIPYFVEQRNQDAKRIAQLQQETIELFKRIDAVTNRLPLLEANIQKASQAVEAVLPIPAELRHAQESFIEQVKLAQVDQERQLRDFHDEIMEHRDTIAAQQQRFRELTEAAEASKRAVQAIEQFQQAIQREQNQVAELQRLSEERQRKALDTFREEYEKRWQKEMLGWRQRWQQQEQLNQRLEAQFPPLVAQIKACQEHIQQLWQLQEEFGSHRLHEAQRWLDMLDEALDKRDEIDRSDGQGPRETQNQ
ncbi:MAG: hypothetical protein J7M34_10700 [Anaerolineae bacterium]|nr:hypothetical protein [Anaerolineae bacterium]